MAISKTGKKIVVFNGFSPNFIPIAAKSMLFSEKFHKYKLK